MTRIDTPAWLLTIMLLFTIVGVLFTYHWVRTKLAP